MSSPLIYDDDLLSIMTPIKQKDKTSMSFLDVFSLGVKILIFILFSSLKLLFYFVLDLDLHF